MEVREVKRNERQVTKEEKKYKGDNVVLIIIYSISRLEDSAV